MKSLSKRTMFWSTITIVLLIGVFFANRDPVQIASVAKVEVAAFEQSFLEEGKTRLKRRYLVTAPVNGFVRRIELQPGDPIRANQVVAELDPATSSLLDPRSRADAQAEIAAARSSLNAAKQRSLASKTAAEVAANEFQRIQKLSQSSAVSASLLDQSRANAELAQAQLTGAQADVQIASRRAQAAQALLLEEGKPGRGMTLPILAPIDAVVLRRYQESASPVVAAQPLLEIGNPAELEIEVEALSTDAVRLRAGMPARILRWGGEQQLDAIVQKIEPSGFTKISALGVEEQRTRIILDLVSPQHEWASLGDAYRVEVTFILQQQEALLQIPVSALFRIRDGWAVYRVLNGKAQRLEVQIGARSATAAQVVSGLAENDVVILQPDDRIKDGTRIRAVIN